MILWHFRGFGSSSHTVSAGGGHLSDRENLIRGKRRCPSSNCDAEFLFFPSVMSDPTQWFTLNGLYRNCIFQLRHSCRWGREKRSHTVRVGCVNINAKHISANKKKANKYKKPRVALALQGLQQSLPVSLFKKFLSLFASFLRLTETSNVQTSLSEHCYRSEGPPVFVWVLSSTVPHNNS